MPRESYVWREGRMIPKFEAMVADYRSNEKNISELPCPGIIGDNVEYKSTIDGRMITGRRQHREHLRENGYIEMGNESPSHIKKPPLHAPGEIKKAVKDAIDQSRAGYIPPDTAPVGSKDDEGKTIEAPEVGSIEIDGVPENGTMIRTDARDK